MPKIVIIGSSAAGFAACQLLASHAENEVALISKEEYLPYARARLIEYFSGAIRQEELFLCAQDFFQGPAITFLPNAEVVKVDVGKRRLSLKDTTKIAFDFLIVASGATLEVPDLPGRLKEGVAVFYSLEDVERIKKRLLVARNVSIIGAQIRCMLLAEVFLAKYNKEVKVICDVCNGPFEGRDRFEVIAGCKPLESIGEGELQALKLNNGKVIATDIALFVDGFVPATNFLKESGVKTEKGFIVVDECMRTSVENIFACGSVCGGLAGTLQAGAWDASVRQGVIAAEEVLKMIERGKIPCQTS